MEYLAGGSCLDLVSGVMPWVWDLLGNRALLFCLQEFRLQRCPLSGIRASALLHLDNGLAGLAVTSNQRNVTSMVIIESTRVNRYTCISNSDPMGRRVHPLLGSSLAKASTEVCTRPQILFPL